ncbi:hypothetical protein [Aquidulcibacter paucihalophilus]|uniref:hypothetical protein n=1 Tax=Aquidulcibacter paucihalophilus TaxID=1978549 RepID=UPI000A18CA1E|nr:hypothetical protein [Aquidulcibacter paucihalophilus]
MPQVEPTTSKWLATFDDLTALPKARVAVFVYALLSGLALVAIGALLFPLHKLALIYVPVLGTQWAFEPRYGGSFNADLGAMILTICGVLAWTKVLPFVSKIAVSAGGKTKEVPQ